MHRWKVRVFVGGSMPSGQQRGKRKVETGWHCAKWSGSTAKTGVVEGQAEHSGNVSQKEDTWYWVGRPNGSHLMWIAEGERGSRDRTATFPGRRSTKWFSSQVLYL
ncbi:hypothetical protein M413DRAFT_14788 [Hebeloma cylindrosporum]|uniref:Uncharacterized protein n=1 Tax=Hebeloma cylindrosporum TaxID=76867 RepID=A0A0C3BSG7_HEBCY|nr:hypothetical protein M413DRAFT_14788 [Hebeloma cylindrosporum h7]